MFRLLSARIICNGVLNQRPKTFSNENVVVHRFALTWWRSVCHCPKPVVVGSSSAYPRPISIRSEVHEQAYSSGLIHEMKLDTQRPATESANPFRTLDFVGANHAPAAVDPRIVSAFPYGDRNRQSLTPSSFPTSLVKLEFQLSPHMHVKAS